MKSVLILLIGIMLGVNATYLLFQERVLVPTERRVIKRTITKYKSKRKAKLTCSQILKRYKRLVKGL